MPGIDRNAAEQDLGTGRLLAEVLILAYLLTHYITTDCSLNYKKNACSIHILFFVFVLTFKTICVSTQGAFTNY